MNHSSSDDYDQEESTPLVRPLEMDYPNAASLNSHGSDNVSSPDRHQYDSGMPHVGRDPHNRPIPLDVESLLNDSKGKQSESRQNSLCFADNSNDDNDLNSPDVPGKPQRSTFYKENEEIDKKKKTRELGYNPSSNSFNKGEYEPLKLAA